MRPRAAIPALNLIAAVADSNLFGRWFEPLDNWSAWFVVVKAIFGLPMTPAEVEVFTRFTGRTTPPTMAAREAWLVVGRRGGKSRIAALVSVFLAAFRDHRPYLAPGERGVLLVVAADRAQARVVFSYVTAFLEEVPLLRPLIVRRTAESIDLTNRVTIEVGTASYRTIRGRTLIGVVADEIAFWRTEDSANPDTEILTAIRPGMATIPGALLVAISSPYARRGELWKAHKDHYGQDGDPVLVWQADTRSMNPTVDEQVIADAYAQDEAAALAEFGAQFRRDIESLLSREIVEACVEAGCHGRPPRPDIHYVGFVDPSGGVGDSFALAIAHAEGADVVLDLVHERRAPLSPEAAVEAFVGLLAPYSVRQVIGDRYSEEWVRERFRSQGIGYEVSRWTKSDLYVELLPLLTSRRARLLDDTRLVAQLLSLERRTGGSGKDMITHPRDGHDDVANAAAGALVHLGRRGQLGFEGWKPYVPEAARPIPAAQIIERTVFRCQTRGCTWEEPVAFPPSKCPACSARGPTWQAVMWRV